MTKNILLLRLNNHPHEFADYITIFQACLLAKRYIPRFCYHMALKIAGNCRMCLIEEKSSLKPLASCAITITNGMGIQTETEMIKKAREGVLEYLLINHPLDCPICDQGGECDLQDQTMVFGADRGRFYEHKRSTPNKNVGYLIKTFLNRCIHCARCTRFLADLTGTSDLQLLGRGLRTEIATYTDRFITSEVSGNIADLCPVGALTSKPYAFKARPWELVPAYTFDIMDALGANIEVNYRGTEIMRILPHINRTINGEWITDKTRFFYDAIMLQRLSEPYVCAGTEFSTLSWFRSFEFSKNALLAPCFYNELTIISLGFGSFVDLETSIALRNFNSLYGLKMSLEPFLGVSDGFDLRSSYTFKIEQLESDFLKTRNLILVNLNLRYESPLLNIQIRAHQQEHELEVLLIGYLSNTNFTFVHLGSHAFLDSFFRFFEKNFDTVVLVGGQNFVNPYYSFFKNQTNYVWTKISHLTYLETMSIKNVGTNASFGMNVGVLWPDVPISSVYGLISSNFLHHMIDDYLLPFASNVFWPTKFYLEKVSSFMGNVGHFFSTIINIFGFNIRGTKEEHRILEAFDEIIENKLESITFEKVNLSKFDMNEKPILFFASDSLSTYTYPILNHVTVKSVINDYYLTNELCQISPVLGLCSKRYGVLNDYLWVSPIINKC